VTAALRAENAELRSENAGLRAQVTELAGRVARLERLISRNSGNSSLPPSSDDQPGKKQPAQPRRREDGKRQPGKQPGAPGAHLAWSQNPDKAIPHFPEGGCECGADLGCAEDLGVAYSHQVTDIPQATATVTQHDRHSVRCRCGRVHVAPAPEGVTGTPGTVTYGPHLQALSVFLLVMHHVPVARCGDIIGSLCGARPSDGFVHALLERAARGVAAANKLIRALVILARVVCADETPVRVGPGPKTRKKYLLVACTNMLTYYFLGGRDLGTFKAFVLPDLSGAVVHDRYQNYDAFPGIAHQLCAAHLLRDLEDAAETYPDAVWPGQIADTLRALIHAANLAREQGLPAVPDDTIAGELRLFRHGVAVGLSEIRRVPGSNEKQPPGRLLLECLRDRRDDVLRFLSDLRIPPTSNQAERDLRPAKTQQKISGRLRSEQATRDRYAIRGYISTAAKHGASILAAIHGALAGKPWMPPIPGYI
jgi:transposase